MTRLFVIYILSAAFIAVAHAGTMNIDFKEFDLDNGLHVIVHEDHSSAIVVLDVRYHVGSKNEVSGKTGFEHLFEHLMFDGSKNVGRGMFDKYLTNVGAQNNAYTTADETNYHEVVPSNQVELALWLESDRMLQFAIKEISLKTQKEVVKEEKRQTDDNRPYGDLDEKMREMAYTGGCYRWPVIGSMQDIDAATLDDVRQFYEMYYVPNNATLCLGGDITLDEAKRLVTKYFGGIPSGKQPVRRPSYNEKPQAKENRLILHEDVPAPGEFIAFHVPGENDTIDMPALELLSSILGSGESSRLQHSLVYEQQRASDAGAYVDINELSSLLYVYALAAKPDQDMDVVEQEMLRHLAEIGSNGVTDTELQKAKNQKEASIVYGFASSLGIADALTHAYTLDRNTNSVNTEIDKYSRVTVDDIKRVAQKYLTVENRNIVRYLPKDEDGE